MRCGSGACASPRPTSRSRATRCAPQPWSRFPAAGVLKACFQRPFPLNLGCAAAAVSQQAQSASCMIVRKCTRDAILKIAACDYAGAVPEDRGRARGALHLKKRRRNIERDWHGTGRGCYLVLGLLKCIMDAPSLIALQHNACGISWCETCQTSQPPIIRPSCTMLRRGVIPSSFAAHYYSEADNRACVVRQPHFCHAAVARRACLDPILNRISCIWELLQPITFAACRPSALQARCGFRSN